MRIYISTSAVAKSDKIVVKYGKDQWYAGEVSKVARDGVTVSVKFNDGSTDTVAVTKVKKIAVKGKKTPYTDTEANALVSKYRDKLPVKVVGAKPKAEPKPAKPKAKPVKLSIVPPASNTNIPSKEFKALAKRLSLPSTGRFSGDNYFWDKQGGYAGENALKRVMEAAKKAGFKPGSTKYHNSPDGSVIGSGDVYTDGTYDLHLYSSYGVTAASNNYSITLTKISQ